MDVRTKIMMEDLAESAGVVLALVLLAVLAWLYLAATPTQNSAECDEAAIGMENARR